MQYKNSRIDLFVMIEGVLWKFQGRNISITNFRNPKSDPSLGENLTKHTNKLI